MPELQRFKLADTDPNVTEDSTWGTTWRDTWDFECPSHMMIYLQPGDLFSLKAYDSADVEYVIPTLTDNGAEVKVEVRDASGQKKILIYGPANYLSSKEFQEYKKMAKLRIEQPIVVKPRDHIVFMTKDHTGMDAASVANSFCLLQTSRKILVEGGRL